MNAHKVADDIKAVNSKISYEHDSASMNGNW